MHSRALITLSVLATAISCSGCVVSQSTKGYQTNPPARSVDGLSRSPSNGSGGQGLQKFFSGWGGGKSSQPVSADPQVASGSDATSLDTPATVSVDLLVVAGEMALEQQRFDLALNYFERALKMEPDSARAKSGLSKARSQTARNPVNTTETNGQSLPQQLKDLLGQAPTEPDQSSNRVQLASFAEEVAEVAPDSIAVESFASVQDPNMTLNPVIRAGTALSSQRVANPFFSERAVTVAKTSRSPMTRVFKIKPAKAKFQAQKRTLSDDQS